jgi:hypothetical protein
MKVAFISTSLAAGKDGIGDYCRVLAPEFLREEHEVRLLAINDGFIAEPTEAMQSAGGFAIPTLRLPSEWSWRRKASRAREWLEDFGAEIIYLQFAPYSYGHRGVPLGFLAQARTLFAGRRVFVVVHELWLGGVRLTPWKQRQWGIWVQRPVFALLMKRIRPVAIVTSSPLYQLILRSSGIRARLLPIPSNIPVVDEARPGAAALLAQHGVDPPSGWCVFGLFGEAHAGADYVDSLAPYLRDAEARGLRSALVFIGRNGRHAEAVRARLGQVYSDRLKLVVVGEQPPEMISGLIANTHYGLATSPRQLLGKSGSAAAFRAHGRPLIICHKWVLPEYGPWLDAVDSCYVRVCQGYALPAATYKRLAELTAAAQITPTT